MLKMNIPTEGLTPTQDMVARYVEQIFTTMNPACIHDARHFITHHVIQQFQFDLALVVQACLSHEDTPTH